MRAGQPCVIYTDRRWTSAERGAESGRGGLFYDVCELMRYAIHLLGIRPFDHDSNHGFGA